VAGVKMNNPDAKVYFVGGKVNKNLKERIEKLCLIKGFSLSKLTRLALRKYIKAELAKIEDKTLKPFN